MAGFIRAEFARLRGQPDTALCDTVRVRFGSYLLLGLEFLIAADIIGTVVKPTPTDVAVLGGTVVIRTAISYFPTTTSPPAGRDPETQACGQWRHS